MKNRTETPAAMASRTIEEIAFQNSLFALNAAVGGAGAEELSAQTQCVNALLAGLAGRRRPGACLVPRNGRAAQP
ncbi:MAG TPA: hypothetical protein VGF59_29110 [Bryobacteraceae bacterium]|jgi:hypothetical protein